MRLMLSIACFLMLPATAHAEAKYKAIIHVLQTDGSYVKHELTATQQGVSRVECDMRTDAWEADMAVAIATAKRSLKERGQSGDMRITCEAVD